MDKTPLEAYMDMLMMPARIQAVMFGDWLQLGLDATPFMSGQAALAVRGEEETSPWSLPITGSLRRNPGPN